MMKIKKEKEMNLHELIKWAWENGIKKKDFVGSEGGRVKFDFRGWFKTSMVVEPHETFTVEVEEEITEETVIPKLIELYSGGFSHVVSVRPDKSIKTVKEMREKEGFELVAFYMLNDDMTMTLIWKDGEMVE